MQIHIISVGKLGKDFASIAEEYYKMIKWKVKSSEITYTQKLPPTQIKQHEAKLIAKHLTQDAITIILDVEGKLLSSEEFAGIFNAGGMLLNKDIDFIIGGAFGLDASIKALAARRISLSKLTLSHKIAKIVLLEQVYRAQSILEGHPYHK